ncbi:conjugal transfer protein TraN [Paraburkholderia pallida]|uniref:conjugal transfer protein TraN n=1 Tax=Paraburkholderia pallida TaxID=2547399 RepID=UPI0018D7C2BB|nr:conjugal transfer protein TraN [Paraburkholderia pallida]
MISRTHAASPEAERAVPQKVSLAGQATPAPAPLREFGFPTAIQAPLFAFSSDQILKAHHRYKEAKSGDSDAAIALVYDLAVPLFNAFVDKIESGEIPLNHVLVAPHAREASGDNAIPQVLAALLSIGGGRLDEEIVQTTKVYHTGADPMERLNARASFHGKIERGMRYVLVDDVTTLGGTLCDLSDFIQRGGGNPVAAVVLVNASRSGRLYPNPKTIVTLEARGLGNEIRETFNIEPRALSADEAHYLVGFRSIEEIRGRSAKAQQKTDLRLRAKGIRVDEGIEQLNAALRHRRPWRSNSRAVQLSMAGVRSSQTPRALTRASRARHTIGWIGRKQT